MPGFVYEERDGDEGYDRMRQRELDEAEEARRAYEAAARRQPAPIPQSCHECGHHYAGAICPTCKTERPAYTALKRITAAPAQRPALTVYPPCRFDQAALCGCGGSGNCLGEAA